jgi:hypothetical protein
LNHAKLLWRSASLVASSALFLVAACGERTPTALEDQQIPGQPISLEVQLPWSQFGSNFQVFGGFGSPSRLDEGIVASGFADTLDARTLLRFSAYPLTATIYDSNNNLRSVEDLTFHDGWVRVVVDPSASTATGPVTLALSALQSAWDPISATWDNAVDSVGDQRPWPEAGAGPVTPLSTALWTPGSGDSVEFHVDSTQIAAWGSEPDSMQGARIDLVTSGARLHLVDGGLILNTTSLTNPDTTLELSVSASRVTFVYDPPPPPPGGELRVGGAPAWRSTFNISVPTELNGPPELCAEVGCPFELQPQHVSYAALELTSSTTSAAYQPADSMGFDVRAVLDPSKLPKSPLSSSLASSSRGYRFAPDVFGASAEKLVEIPITTYVRGYLAGPDASGRPPPSAIALLSAAEPAAFWYASFHGPGDPSEPVLKLILTVSRPMELQ